MDRLKGAKWLNIFELSVVRKTPVQQCLQVVLSFEFFPTKQTEKLANVTVNDFMLSERRRRSELLLTKMTWKSIGCARFNLLINMNRR